MTEIKTTKIPRRLKCVDKDHPYIGGSVDIIDDSKNKTQEQINSETEERVSTLEQSVGTGGSVDERIAEEGARHYLKTETYSKTELNNMITTPEVEYVNVEATDQTTDISDVLPATGAANTIYKIGSWDGSQYDQSKYSEYTWNGTQYIPLATRDHGVDETFQEGSSNLVESKAIFISNLPIFVSKNNFDGAINGVYLGSDKGLTTSAQYSVIYLAVNEGEKYRIKTNANSAAAYMWRTYSEAPYIGVPTTSVVRTGSKTTALEEDVTIQSGEAYLAVTYRTGYSTTVELATYSTILKSLEEIKRSLQEVTDKKIKTPQLYDLSQYSMGVQHSCIIHDNFMRQAPDTSKPWQIGVNYSVNQGLFEYISNRSDYDTVDDGFRLNPTFDENTPAKLISGYLTNDRTVGVSESFRLVKDYTKIIGNFMIEVSVPSILNSYAEVVYNFDNEGFYNSFVLFKDSSYKLNLQIVDCVNGKRSSTTIYQTNIDVKSMRFFVINNSLIIYQDNTNINMYLSTDTIKAISNLEIESSKKIGIRVNTGRTYEYRVFDVYNLVERTLLEQNDHITDDNVYGMFTFYGKRDGNDQQLLPYSLSLTKCIYIVGVTDNPSSLTVVENNKYINTTDNKVYVKQGGVFVEYDDLRNGYMYADTFNHKLYLYDNDTLTEQGEFNFGQGYINKIHRFELRAADCTSAADDRSELESIESTWNDRKVMLRKVHYSFDVLFPSNALDNDNIGGEAFHQINPGVESASTKKGRTPAFTLATEVLNGALRYHLNKRYIPTKPIPIDAEYNENVYGDEDVDLGEVTLGKWEHFEVFIHEGYMKEHVPYLIVKRNGNVVYQSNEPNTYNVVTAPQIRYGIYKAAYLPRYSPAATRKRIIYFANFKLEI